MTGRGRRRTVWAASVSALLALLAGCSSPASTVGADVGHGPLGSSDASATATPSAEPDVIDVAALPEGRPPQVPYLAGGVLHGDGRHVRTDLAPGVGAPQIFGAVDGRVVLYGYKDAPHHSGERFWAVGQDGHAVRLGGIYRSYDYAPRLVESTGHVWVHHTDRTTPLNLWEIDVRTGREIAHYSHGHVPRGLAPDDQALVDAWVARRDAVSDFEALSEDGTRWARVRPVSGSNEVVVVRRVADRSVLARFVLPPWDDDHQVSRLVFEGRQHVLVLVTVSSSRRAGPHQAIVRCSVADGTCERATDIGGPMALGVVRPLFGRLVPKPKPTP